MSKLKKLTFSAHEWAPFGDAFTRILACVEAPELADHRLYQDCLSGRLETAKLDISPDGSETVTSLNPSDWRQLKVLGGRVAGNFEGGYFFVRRADLDKHYSIAATTTMMAAHQSDDTRPPQRRRGPILKHQWHAIAGEIARRCINPKTRLLEIPKIERKLAADMLGWCQERYGQEPAESEMRDAVKEICAALRRRTNKFRPIPAT